MRPSSFVASPALGLLVTLVGGCPTPDVEVPPGEVPTCDAVDCGTGRCVVAGGAAQCVCDPGFGPDGDTCVACADHDDGDVHITRLAPKIAAFANGQVAPASPYDAGAMWLQAVDGPDELLASYSHLGDQTTSLVPGDYALRYEGVGYQSAMPANHQAVFGERAVWNEDPIVFDVPVTALSGVFTVNGAAPPGSAYDTGDLFLVDPVTGDAILLGPSSWGGYTTRVVPGTYEVHYRAVASGTTMPANTDATLSTVVVPAGTATLDIDVPAVTVSLELTQDGNAMPAAASEQGEVHLRADDDTVYLGRTTFDGFEARVVPGTYDIVYDHLAGSTVPANHGAVVGTIDTSVDTTLDVDLSTQLVSVVLTLDGGDFPSSPLETASLWFRDQETGGLTLVATTHTDPTARLLTGAYDIVYAYDSGHVVPANRFAVIGTFVSPTRQVTIDLQTTALSGEVRLNGELAPASPYQAGTLWLEGGPDGEDRVDLGPTWLQHLDARVIRGDYTVYYGLQTGSLMPANQRRALTGLTLDTAAVANDLDLATQTVSGDVFVNEVAPSGVYYESGMLVLVDPDTGDEAFVGHTRDGSYEARVFPGTYDVHFRFELGGAEVPTNLDARVGCVDVPRGLVAQ